jgi:hypothetical protein
MRILKWELRLVGMQTIELPSQSKILTVQMQRQVPCMWTLCDESLPMEKLDVVLMPTGYEAPDWHYRGTVQLHGGELVFHAFTRWQGLEHVVAQPAEAAGAHDVGGW